MKLTPPAAGGTARQFELKAFALLMRSTFPSVWTSSAVGEDRLPSTCRLIAALRHGRPAVDEPWL